MNTGLQIFSYIVVVGVVFSIIIYIRNKIEYSNEYVTYKKTDGLILMLIFYILVFFVNTNIRNLSLDLSYQLPDFRYLEQFNWLPFSWISSQLEMVEFYEFIYGDYHQDFPNGGLHYIYLQLVIHLLPISYIIYIISKNKWIGFILAECVTIFVMLFKVRYLIGDGVLIVAITYLLLLTIGSFVSRGLSKDDTSKNSSSKLVKLLISYSVAGILMLLATYIVLEVHYYNYDNEKLIGTIEIDEKLEFYNGLLNLELTHVSYYEGGRSDEVIKFNGKLNVDKSLYHYFGDDLNNKIDITYTHEFYGTPHHFGYDELDFSYYDPDIDDGGLYRFPQNLTLENYGTYKEIGDEWEKVKDDQGQQFFTFKGISNIGFRLDSEYSDVFFEMVDSDFGEDEYMYYEYSYKIYKVGNQDLTCYVHPYGDKPDGGYISLLNQDPVILEETDEYTLFKRKAYFYPGETYGYDTDKIEPRAYSASMSIELIADEIFLSYDKEDFLKD